jgi:hypothetical protein
MHLAGCARLTPRPLTSWPCTAAPAYFTFRSRNMPSLYTCLFHLPPSSSLTAFLLRLFLHCTVLHAGIYVKPGRDRDALAAMLKREGYLPVWLESGLLDLYYNGFCNSVLWQLFHYVPLQLDGWQRLGEHQTLQMQWGAYQQVRAWRYEYCCLVGCGYTFEMQRLGSTRRCRCSGGHTSRCECGGGAVAVAAGVELCCWVLLV